MHYSASPDLVPAQSGRHGGRGPGGQKRGREGTQRIFSRRAGVRWGGGCVRCPASPPCGRSRGPSHKGSLAERPAAARLALVHFAAC